MRHEVLREQIPANASALPIIRVPEGTTTKLAYVCDISGMLFVSVDHDVLIQCPTGECTRKGGGGKETGAGGMGRCGGGAGCFIALVWRA